MDTETKACGNPDCHCPAPSVGDYCSDYCEDPSLADQSGYDQPIETGIKKICYCDHAECGVD
jgi:hypothetical protein